MHLFNITYRKIGGIRFLRIGRLFVSFGISRTVPVMEAGTRYLETATR